MNVLHLIYNNTEAIRKHTSRIWLCDVHEAEAEKAKPFFDWFEELDGLLVEAGMDQHIDVAVLDGCETSNGHAFLLDGTPTAWISASHYPSLNTIKVFATHEVVHALHYGYAPAYAFAAKKEKNHVGRQLVTEGVATYVTQTLLGISAAEALWSDYLEVSKRDELMRRYRAHQAASAAHILKDWDTHESQYFYADNSKDVDSYRSGYFIGLEAIRQIAQEKELSLLDLLRTQRAGLDPLVMEQLKAFQV